MSEHALFDAVDQARERLSALCTSLESKATASGSQDVVATLREVQETFDKLQARYGLLREILNRTNDVVFAKDRLGRYSMINPQGADMFGKSMVEILGTDDSALFVRADAERIMAVDREVMRTGKPNTQEDVFDFRGVPTALRTATTAWYDDKGHVRGVIGIVQDVTERRRIEREALINRDRMRSMSAEIVIGEERLRRLLAAELHSGLGQEIALARMKVSGLRKIANAELHEPLTGIEKLVEQADQSLRSITVKISPPSLHDLGLVPALQWLAEDVSRKYALDVAIEDDKSPAIADERVRVILFRAVRELLINAATHAYVGKATVRLSGEGGIVRITVMDAGVGFDTADLDRRGYGLFGISEQLKYVDGSIQITSAPGRGTTVTLTAPVADPLTRGA